MYGGKFPPQETPSGSFRHSHDFPLGSDNFVPRNFDVDLNVDDRIDRTVQEVVSGHARCTGISLSDLAFLAKNNCHLWNLQDRAIQLNPIFCLSVVSLGLVEARCRRFPPMNLAISVHVNLLVMQTSRLGSNHNHNCHPVSDYERDR